jgi:hypothetical protein
MVSMRHHNNVVADFEQLVATDSALLSVVISLDAQP